jgi:hypothetical protein
VANQTLEYGRMRLEGDDAPTPPDSLRHDAGDVPDVGSDVDGRLTWIEQASDRFGHHKVPDAICRDPFTDGITQIDAKRQAPRRRGIPLRRFARIPGPRSPCTRNTSSDQLGWPEDVVGRDTHFSQVCATAASAATWQKHST